MTLDHGGQIVSADVLESVCAQTTARDKRHRKLLAALRQRYPDRELLLVATRGGWWKSEPGIVDVDGARIAEAASAYLRSAIAEHGSAAAARDQIVAQRLQRTTVRGETLYLAIPYGPRPQDYVQIEIDRLQEWIEGDLFEADPFFARERHPRDLDDLLKAITHGSAPSTARPLDAPYYALRRITDIARHVGAAATVQRDRELARIARLRRTDLVSRSSNGKETRKPYFQVFPQDAEPRSHRLERLMRDWSASRAGDARRFCECWFIEDHRYRDTQGEVIDGIPQWADGRRLPEIHSKTFRSVTALMDRLESFDTKAGYPFAWYFYMLHGNRIGAVCGERVAEAIRQGRLHLDPRDERVLLRWEATPYAF